MSNKLKSKKNDKNLIKKKKLTPKIKVHYPFLILLKVN